MTDQQHNPTMQVKVTSEEEARRLQLDGYNRKGKKDVYASLDDLADIVERDDVDIRSVILHRDYDDEEAGVINREIMKHSGKVKTRYAKKPRREHGLVKGKEKLFSVSEDKLSIYNQYLAVVEGDYDLSIDEEQFSETKEKVLTGVDNDIADLQERISELKETKKQIDSLDPADL